MLGLYYTPKFNCLEVMDLFYAYFPNANYSPTSLFKQGGYFVVVPNIAFSFFIPILRIIGRTSVPTIVSVPKAAVNKYSNLFIKKNKIGMPFYGIVSSPSRYIVFFERGFWHMCG